MDGLYSQLDPVGGAKIEFQDYYFFVLVGWFRFKIGPARLVKRIVELNYGLNSRISAGFDFFSSGSFLHNMIFKYFY